MCKTLIVLVTVCCKLTSSFNTIIFIFYIVHPIYPVMSDGVFKLSKDGNFSSLCPNGSQWVWDGLGECAQDARDMASVILGLLSIVCFMVSSIPWVTLLVQSNISVDFILSNQRHIVAEPLKCNMATYYQRQLLPCCWDVVRNINRSLSYILYILIDLISIVILI